MVTMKVLRYVQGYSTKKLVSMGDFAGEFVGPKFAQITQLLVFCQILGEFADTQNMLRLMVEGLKTLTHFLGKQDENV